MNSLNERVRVKRGEVLHGRSAQREEQPPASPPHLVDEVLSPLTRAVLQQRPQHRMPDLGMACLVGLDARHRLLEQMVVSAVRHSRHGHELQAGKACLEHEVELDREVDGVGGEHHVIKQVRNSTSPIGWRTAAVA
jgi:hypothetical protein